MTRRGVAERIPSRAVFESAPIVFAIDGARGACAGNACVPAPPSPRIQAHGRRQGVVPASASTRRVPVSREWRSGAGTDAAGVAAKRRPARFAVAPPRDAAGHSPRRGAVSASARRRWPTTRRRGARPPRPRFRRLARPRAPRPQRRGPRRHVRRALRTREPWPCRGSVSRLSRCRLSRLCGVCHGRV